jgi:hypothetical protein
MPAVLLDQRFILAYSCWVGATRPVAVAVTVAVDLAYC